MKNRLFVKVNRKDNTIEIKRGLFGTPTIYSGEWLNATIDDIIYDYERMEKTGKIELEKAFQW